MNHGLLEKDILNIMSALKIFPEIEEAYIFGSRAIGNFKKGSDVDIAVKGKHITENTITRLKDILEEELPLPYFFDVVNYENIKNNDLITHIEQFGIKIYSRLKEKHYL